MRCAHYVLRTVLRHSRGVRLVFIFGVLGIFTTQRLTKNTVDVRQLPCGILTPYALTPGGGERYLLQVLANFQRLGHTTELLVNKHADCNTYWCILRTAELLNISIDLQKLSVAQYEMGELKDKLERPEFNLFFLLGNEKFPAFPGRGSINIYMCQFPFDLERFEGPLSWQNLMTYDYVLFNSKYSYSWHSQLITPYIPLLQRHRFVLPSFEVLYPPVSFQTEHYEQSEFRRHIAVLGRVFEGRQSKGHDTALTLFARLAPALPIGTKLYLIGNIQPGHQKYAQRLKSHAEKSGVNVEFLFSVSNEVIHDALSRSLIFWHLTGVNIDEKDDPASIEHFGIAIVEAMGSGCIPIVTRRGGPIEIVEHGSCGYHADDFEEFAKHTKSFFGMHVSEQQRMSVSCFQRAQLFSVKAFDSGLQFLIQRGNVAKPFRQFVTDHISTQAGLKTSLPVTSVFTAAIVEPGFAFAFEFCVKNVVRHLGQEWALIVFHTAANELFVRSATTGIENVSFIRLPPFTKVLEYNKLMKSAWFWDSIPAEKALIFQSDSVMIKFNIHEFMEYDYVGAPWHQGNERWGELSARGITEGVGNGGFSLRTVKLMRKIANESGPYSPYTEHEDIFFVSEALKRGYKVASRQVAYNFCLEVPCADISRRQDPLALHAAWYYNQADSMFRLLNKSLA